MKEKEKEKEKDKEKEKEKKEERKRQMTTTTIWTGSPEMRKANKGNTSISLCHTKTILSNTTNICRAEERVLLSFPTAPLPF